MATTETNLADRSGNLVESFKNYDPRIIFFYFILAGLLVTLIGGLAYQQLGRAFVHSEAERKQNQRRIVFPGPRGNIEDRNGRVLVENRARFSVRLLLDQLGTEFRVEQNLIKQRYEAADEMDVPTYSQRMRIARTTVVQRYLDNVNQIIGRDEKVNAEDLNKHFARDLLLPYTLLDDLQPAEYARLLERIPVKSPMQVYTFSSRHYPYGSAASHTLGYIGTTDDVEVEDLPGEDLKTFKMKGTMGRDGIEKQFDAVLQGESGGAIFRVDPSGNRMNPPLKQVLPKQGRNVQLSLDIDLQMAAEAKLAEFDLTGAAVALDVKTGEVLVLASKPDYDLASFSPRISAETVAKMNETGAWTNYAVNGFWPPGSTFKIVGSIAALRAGAITYDKPIVECDGWMKIGNTRKPCENGRGHHGPILLPEAIAHSCDIYFYTVGRIATPEVIAAEGRRFHLDRPTGIELPGEGHRTIMPDPEWRERTRHEPWYPGDTANMAIGQGDVLVTPLAMACFITSFARDEVWTQPTLLHDPNHGPQHTERIGLTADQRAAIIKGMQGCIAFGTAGPLLGPSGPLRIPGLSLAGKTGTAQKKIVKDGKLGTINYAWFICFAPVEKPEIALAVAIEGDELGANFEGGRNAVPVAHAILTRWLEKKNQPPPMRPIRLKTE